MKDPVLFLAISTRLLSFNNSSRRWHLQFQTLSWQLLLNYIPLQRSLDLLTPTLSSALSSQEFLLLMEISPSKPLPPRHHFAELIFMTPLATISIAQVQANAIYASAKNVSVWKYHFAYTTPGAADYLGISHASELQFVNAYLASKSTGEIAAQSKLMNAYWSSCEHRAVICQLIIRI